MAIQSSRVNASGVKTGRANNSRAATIAATSAIFTCLRIIATLRSIPNGQPQPPLTQPDLPPKAMGHPVTHYRRMNRAMAMCNIFIGPNTRHTNLQRIAEQQKRSVIILPHRIFAPPFNTPATWGYRDNSRPRDRPSGDAPCIPRGDSRRRCSDDRHQGICNPPIRSAREQTASSGTGGRTRIPGEGRFAGGATAILRMVYRPRPIDPQNTAVRLGLL